MAVRREPRSRLTTTLSKIVRLVYSCLSSVNLFLVCCVLLGTNRGAAEVQFSRSRQTGLQVIVQPSWSHRIPQSENCKILCIELIPYANRAFVSSAVSIFSDPASRPTVPSKTSRFFS